MAKSAASKATDSRRLQHREKVDKAFRTRHPARDAEEKGFRKDARARRKAYADRDRHRDEGTPETAQKARSVQQGALARLFQLGHLSADELAWSQEIRQVAERLASDVTIGSVSLETRVDQSRGGSDAFFESLGAARAEVAYTTWRKEQPNPGLVLAMIVEDVSWRTAAARFHIGPQRAKRLLIDALNSWVHHSREARDSIDAADLLAAQAGII